MSRLIFVLVLVVLAAVESSSKCVRSRSEDADGDYSEYQGGHTHRCGSEEKAAAGENERRIISKMRKQIEEIYRKEISSIEPIFVSEAFVLPKTSSLIKALVKHTDGSEAYIHMHFIIVYNTKEPVEFVGLATGVKEYTPLKYWL